MKLSKKRIIIFSLIHVVILLILLVVSFTASMDAFDGKKEIKAFESLAGNITEFLMSPLFLLWNSWASKNIHNSIENILFFCNSVLWGVTIEYVYVKFKKHNKNT